MMDYLEDNTVNTPRAKAAKALRRAYTLFASTTTAVVILGFMALFYVAGTVFPQGATLTEYENAGGGLDFLVTNLDLLALFTTPVFLFLALLLLLNLVICARERYGSVFGKDAGSGFTPEHSLALTQEPDAAAERVREVFIKDLRFRPVESGREWYAFEKGLPSAPLDWFFHAGVAVCFLGFILTYLFAYEGTMRLLPKKASTVVPRETGRLKSLWTEKDGPTDFHLYLDGFATEYAEYPDLDYPDGKKARLAIGLGWASPSYELRSDSLFVTDWKARIKVVKGTSTLYEKTTTVNSPLEYGGYSFYLTGWTDTVRVSVDRYPALVEAPSGKAVFVPGLQYPLVFDDVTSGRVLRLNGQTEDLKPSTTIRRKRNGGYEYLGTVRFGDSITLDGHSITPAGFETGAVIKYRYDPGAGVLWAGGLIILTTLVLRTFVGGARASYEIVDKDGIASLKLSVLSEGLLRSSGSTVEELTRLLTSDDIRPEELGGDGKAGSDEQPPTP